MPSRVSVSAGRWKNYPHLGITASVMPVWGQQVFQLRIHGFRPFLGNAYILLCNNGNATAGLQIVGYPNIKHKSMRMCTNAKSSDNTLMFNFYYSAQRRNLMSTSTLYSLLRMCQKALFWTLFYKIFTLAPLPCPPDSNTPWHQHSQKLGYRIHHWCLPILYE